MIGRQWTDRSVSTLSGAGGPETDRANGDGRLRRQLLAGGFAGGRTVRGHRCGHAREPPHTQRGVGRRRSGVRGRRPYRGRPLHLEEATGRALRGTAVRGGLRLVPHDVGGVGKLDPLQHRTRLLLAGRDRPDLPDPRVSIRSPGLSCGSSARLRSGADPGDLVPADRVPRSELSGGQARPKAAGRAVQQTPSSSAGSPRSWTPS